MTTKYDDVLYAADVYRTANDSPFIGLVAKARWNLENAITSYAQAWSDEQNVALLDQIKKIKFTMSTCDESKGDLESKIIKLNSEAHELSEKLIKCRRENKELRAQCAARNKEQNSLEEQRDHNAECCRIRDEKIKTMNEALEAARLLCANLRNGGTGHMTLVENFDKLDGAING